MNDAAAPWIAAVTSMVALVTAMGAGAAPAAQPADRYDVVHGWPRLPSGEILGQATGVDVDSKGRVWVFHRAGRVWSDPSAPFPVEPIGRSTIWVFDAATGERVAEWGAGRFVMPHGITIDRDDNVWLTDVGLHQVLKFSPDGRLLLVLGEPRVAGNDASHFDQPTDVAVSDDGAVFVSDGYGNSRVLKFAPDGKLLQTWGLPGKGPGQFDLPHGIAIDSAGRVLVADRSNARVQAFDQAGRFLAQWRSPELGRPYAVEPGPSGQVFVADGGDQPDVPPDRSGVAVTDADGRVLARFGRFGNLDGQFRLAHDLVIARDGAVYVADAWGQRVQKFVPRPSSEEADILELIDQFMRAISTNDLKAMAALQMPDGMTYRARPKQGGAIEVVSKPNSAWVQPDQDDGRARLERYWSPTVHVRGHIAVVWTPYEYWLDGKRSHCGIDTFDLVKVDGHWRVANTMWTVEPDGCESLGPPAPSEMRPGR